MTEIQVDKSASANVFLMINFGCEMLFIIDQRLKAQHLSKQKSEQSIDQF